MSEFMEWLQDYLRKTRADLLYAVVPQNQRDGYVERVDWYLMKLSREWDRLSAQGRAQAEAGEALDLEVLAHTAVERDYRQHPAFVRTLHKSAATSLDRAALARAIYYFRHRICMFASHAEAARMLREQRTRWESAQGKAELRETRKAFGIKTPLWERLVPFA
jgi:hypothetical protein